VSSRSIHAAAGTLLYRLPILESDRGTASAQCGGAGQQMEGPREGMQGREHGRKEPAGGGRRAVERLRGLTERRRGGVGPRTSFSSHWAKNKWAY